MKDKRNMKVDCNNIYCIYCGKNKPHNHGINHGVKHKTDYKTYRFKCDICDKTFSFLTETIDGLEYKMDKKEIEKIKDKKKIMDKKEKKEKENFIDLILNDTPKDLIKLKNGIAELERKIEVKRKKISDCEKTMKIFEDLKSRDLNKV